MVTRGLDCQLMEVPPAIVEKRFVWGYRVRRISDGASAWCDR